MANEIVNYIKIVYGKPRIKPLSYRKRPDGNITSIAIIDEAHEIPPRAFSLDESDSTGETSEKWRKENPYINESED